jgi:hypothetical protein
MNVRQCMAAAALVALVWGAVLSAHDITVQGTVAAVDAARVQVRPVAAKAAAPAAWYVVTRDTRVMRGAKTVAFGNAGITVGERIVVIVDEHAETKNLAVEIRLAAK